MGNLSNELWNNLKTNHRLHQKSLKTSQIQEMRLNILQIQDEKITENERKTIFSVGFFLKTLTDRIAQDTTFKNNHYLFPVKKNDLEILNPNSTKYEHLKPCHLIRGTNVFYENFLLQLG